MLFRCLQISASLVISLRRPERTHWMASLPIARAHFAHFSANNNNNRWANIIWIVNSRYRQLDCYWATELISIAKCDHQTFSLAVNGATIALATNIAACLVWLARQSATEAPLSFRWWLSPGSPGRSLLSSTASQLVPVNACPFKKYCPVKYWFTVNLPHVHLLAETVTLNQRPPSVSTVFFSVYPFFLLYI